MRYSGIPVAETAVLSCVSLSLELSGRKVLEDISFEAFSGQVLAVLGESGSGKTSLLRAIAGLVRPSGGAVLINGRDALPLRPGERGISFAFQDYSLFPDRSIARNLDFPLKMKKQPQEKRRRRVSELLSFLGPLFSRRRRERPAAFSMGEKQRVSVGRALADTRPLVLLDEPLSEVDLRSKAKYIRRFRELAREQGAAVLYVTNSREEAMAAADRVLLLREGRLEAVGEPLQLYNNPPTLETASALGERPINTATVSVAEGCAVLEGVPVYREVPDRLGDGCLLGVRPEALYVDPDGPLHGNVVLVEKITPERGFVHLDSPEGWLAAVTEGIFPECGDRVTYSIRKAFFFSIEDGRRV